MHGARACLFHPCAFACAAFATDAKASGSCAAHGLKSPEAIIWARAHIDTTARKGGVKRFVSAPQSASGTNHLEGAPGEYLSAHWSAAGSMQQKSVQAYFIVEFYGARVVQGS